MVANRRSGNADRSGISLRAAASQRQQQRQSAVRQRRNTAAAAASSPGARGSGVPDVYRDLLVEAGVASPAARRMRGVADVQAEPPVKRLKRPGQRSDARKADRPTASAASNPKMDEDEDEEGDDGDEDIEFEDIVIPEPVVQTTLLDSDDEEDDDDDDEGQFVFDDVSFGVSPTAPGKGDDDEPPKTLELNLTAHENNAAMSSPSRGGRGRPPVVRKKPLTRAERQLRVDIHKMHVLCLLSHVAQRNRWCNADAVQDALRPLLTQKMITYLNPGSHLPQFGQTESLKNGLQQVATMFKARFAITERGLKRALWAESPEQLKDVRHTDTDTDADAVPGVFLLTVTQYQLPVDVESILDKDDFIRAARTLGGSRDVGAQLFCALLRTAGVEARLVCSLQPLSFLNGGPTMPKPKAPKTATPGTKPASSLPSIYQSPPASTATSSPGAGRAEDDLFTSPRRRLGHPQAAAYHVLLVSTPPRRQNASSSSAPATPAPHVVRGESHFPVYWVEVLDVAHQKWQPVDPLVTGTQWRPAKLEPPASDKNNQLSYVIGLAADGTAKDVTRRYAKAYTAKTKRTRVDGIVEPASVMAAAAVAAAASPAGLTPPADRLTGTKWLRRALRHFKRSLTTDVDLIEESELTAVVAREPMPRNVADFQNHPVYALERHLRHHEVLLPNATSIGTVAAGSRAPLERIYRRRDVHIAFSADRWYRLGRVVNQGEIPVKWLPKPASARTGELESDRASINEYGADNADDDDDFRGDPMLRRVGRGHPSPNGVPLFALEQTQLYRAPPVVNGRIVAKNKFGNIDIYVPSMVPAGGAHVVEDRAARAAFLLGIDYAPALTGFRFEGRKGTSVLRGAVVAAEYAEAVRAVAASLQDLEAEAEAERHARAMQRMWAVFLRGLRIRHRIRVAAEERGEDVAEGGDDDGEAGDEEDDAEDKKDGAADALGAAMDDGIDYGDGGFLVDDDDFGGGGFIPE